jgi:hypothetical protein
MIQIVPRVAQTAKSSSQEFVRKLGTVNEDRCGWCGNIGFVVRLAFVQAFDVAVRTASDGV